MNATVFRERCREETSASTLWRRGPADPGELFDDVGAGVLHLQRVCEIAALLRTHPPEPPYAVSKLPSSSSPLVDPHRLQLGDKLIELAITEPSGLAIELAAFDKLE